MYLEPTVSCFDSSLYTSFWRVNIKLQHKNEATNRGERGFQGSVKRKVIEEDTSFSKIGVYMGGSKNNGTPKSYILIGFSINHLFWGAIIFGTPI